MKTYRIHLIIVTAALLVCASAVAFLKPPAAGEGRPATAARKVVCYQDSMHPWIKSERPGRCTICDMALTPILEGEKGFGSPRGIVSLSSNNITVLNVQTEPVQRRTLVRTLRVAGTLEADDSRKAIFSAPAPGRVVSLDVGSVGAEVKEGQRMLRFYSPELAVKRQYAQRPTPGSGPMAHDGTNDMATAAPRAPRDPNLGNLYTIDLAAPQSGTVVERNVFAGQYVVEGEKLLTIVDPSLLWFRFDVYEGQLGWLEPGQRLKVSVPALSGSPLQARISLVEPTVNDTTRTAKVRAELPNPIVEGEGKPRRLLHLGMYAEGRIAVEIPQVLAIPRNAVLFPGGTAYAYLQRGDGAYERRRLRLGHQGDDLWEVLDGLKENDRVVTAGNLLIDAQAQFNQPSDSQEEGTLTSAAESRDPGREELPRTVLARVTPPVESLRPTDPDSPKSPALAARPPMRVRTPLPPEGGAEGRPAPAAPAWMAKPIPPEAQLGEDGQPLPPATRSPAAAGRSASIARMIEARMTKGQAMMTAGQEMRAAAQARIESSGTDEAVPTTSAPVLKQSLQGGSSGHPALLAFLTTAGSLGDALAADNLEDYNRRAAELPRATKALGAEITPGDPLHSLVATILGTKDLPPAKDLKEARRAFLPLGSAAARLAQSAHPLGGALAGIKAYHCPMAPSPGLWVQCSGPLRNPYFGAAMLRCGEEAQP